MTYNNNKGENKRVAKNTLFLYFRMFLIMAVSLYTSRVTLAVLGVEDFGIYGVTGGLVTMFSFLNGCMIEASTRFIIYESGKGDKKRINEIFNSSLAIHIFLAIVILFLCETIGVWFLHNKMVIPVHRLNAAFWVFQFSVFTAMFTITQIPYNALIVAHEKMDIYAYVGIFEAISKLVIVYVLSVSNCDVLILCSFCYFLLQVVIICFYRLYCNRHYPESHLCICRNRDTYKSIMSFAGYEFIGSFAYIIQGQGVNIILNVFFGPVVNAARSVAFQVQTAVMQFNNNFLMAVRPNIIKNYAGKDYISMEKMMIISSNLSFYLMLIIMVPLMYEADHVLSLWLGKYPNHSVSFLILIFINCLIQMPGGPRNIVFKASGHVKYLNIFKTIITFVVVALSYLWLKIYHGSPESTFCFVIISAIVNEIVNIILFFKIVRAVNIKRYILDVYGRCLVVCFLSVGMFSMTRSLFGFENAMFSIAFSVACYFVITVVTAFIAGIDSETRKLFTMFILSKIRR